MREETLSTNIVFSGNIVELQVNDVLSCHGAPMKRELIVHTGGVGILPFDEDDRIILIRQFRYGPGRVLLEIPAGRLEPGEDALACGMRELTEETGYAAADWQYLGEILPTPAYCSERIHLYIARGLTFKGQHLDENECVELARFTLDEAMEKVISGEIPDAKTQVALMREWIARHKG